LNQKNLSTMNAILEFIHDGMSCSDTDRLMVHLQNEGITYPEKALRHLQEQVTDRLSYAE
jgi:hypothetical protein